MNEEILEEMSEEILIRISEVLRRRFVLHPNITATQTVKRIEEIIIEEKTKRGINHEL